MNLMRKDWLAYLQALPEPAKRRVTFVAVSVIMAVVVSLWLAYFNNMIAAVAQPAPPIADGQPASSGQGWLTGILKAFSGAIGSLGQYNVTPQH